VNVLYNFMVDEPLPQIKTIGSMVEIFMSAIM